MLLPVQQMIRWSQTCNLYGSVSWEKTTLRHTRLFNAVPAPDVACSFSRDFTSICWCQQISQPYFISSRWSGLSRPTGSRQSRTVIQDSEKSRVFKPVPGSWLQHDIHQVTIETNDGRMTLLLVKILNGSAGANQVEKVTQKTQASLLSLLRRVSQWTANTDCSSLQFCGSE